MNEWWSEWISKWGENKNLPQRNILSHGCNYCPLQEVELNSALFECEGLRDSPSKQQSMRNSASTMRNWRTPLSSGDLEEHSRWCTTWSGMCPWHEGHFTSVTFCELRTTCRSRERHQTNLLWGTSFKIPEQDPSKLLKVIITTSDGSVSHIQSF